MNYITTAYMKTNNYKLMKYFQIVDINGHDSKNHRIHILYFHLREMSGTNYDCDISFGNSMTAAVGETVVIVKTELE